MQYSAPKGTFDIVPNPVKKEEGWKDSSLWNYIESVLKQTAHDFGYQEIRTPIFEQTDLFCRSSGDSSDIVSKEMYTFEDKGKRSMSLRPEGTAPVIRAFVDNHFQQSGSLHKLFYIGPFFRYDRPQAGRYRQFHQFGIEAIGDNSPYQDVEIIDLSLSIYKRLGIKNLNLLLNSVGDKDSRDNYKTALIKYLTPYEKDLSRDSQERLSKNPLRILDSKDSSDQKILAEAPSILDYLSKPAADHFDKACEILAKNGISFTITSKLVRGLDYYNQTVFEITSETLGAQSSIGAGGRYDGLLKELGGQDLPSMGFAAGIERILLTMKGQNTKIHETLKPTVYLIALGKEAEQATFSILCRLRSKKISAEMPFKTKKMQKSLQDASQKGFKYCAILGEDELSQNIIQLKNLETRSSENVPIDSIVSHLEKLSKACT